MLITGFAPGPAPVPPLPTARPTGGITRRALAWRYGAASGLEVLRDEWDPGTEAAGAAELMKAAHTALRDAAGAPARNTRNQVTAGRLQVRLGHDLLWYPYTRSADAYLGPLWPPT